MTSLFLHSALAIAAVQATPQADSAPIITTVASGEVSVAADRAVLTIGVVFRDSSATEAGARLARAINSVRDTLTQLGFPADSIPTTRFGVTPEYSYEGERELLGYNAFSAMEVTLVRLDEIGRIIDGALAAGANDITSIEYQTSRLREARSEALRRAVREARDDADALAAAGGGTLGELIALSTADTRGLGGGLRIEGVVVRGATAQGTAVSPRQVQVSITVTAQWRFVPQP